MKLENHFLMVPLAFKFMAMGNMGRRQNHRWNSEESEGNLTVLRTQPSRLFKTTKKGILSPDIEKGIGGDLEIFVMERRELEKF